MADHGYRFDRRDTQFVLFEHLRAQRLFETPQHEHFHKSDVDLLLSEAIKLAENVLAACNESGDREGCRFDNGHVRVPPSYREAYRQQCAGGWMAISTEPEFGGHGLPFVFGASVGEAFIGANSALSMLPGLTRGASELLIACGNDEIKQLYVPHLVSGRWQGTMCLTEPHAGSAVGMVSTSAVKRNGQYFIKGNKIFISGGDHDLVDNVIHLVLARLEGAPAGTKGLSLFLVPKIRVNADGSLGEPNDVTCVGIEKKLGIHGSPTCALSFGEQDRCLGLLVGEEQQGIEVMFRMMNFARVGCGLQGVALGAAAYQFALDYARRRVQGVDMKNIRDPNAPSVLITAHPDVRRMLATMKAYTEGGRALLLYTALCLDLMTCSTDPAERERLAGRVELLTPLCKAWCTDTGFKVAELALQTLGGHGYLKDYPVEQHLRDVKIASIYEGTNGIQAIDLLGRKVGRKQGTLFLDLMGLLAEFIDAHRQHPQLGKSIEMLGERKSRLEQVTMNFAMSQMSGDLDYPLLSASPYLRVFSNVIIGWLLLEQGLVADSALHAIYAQAGAKDDTVQSALRAEHEDAQFYFNKIKTAQFFASNLLTENDGLVAAIESGDRSPLEMHF